MDQSARTGLPESGSLLLDVVRFGAALMVVIDHLTLGDFRLGYCDRQVLGYIAVPIFFVLSGFVIRYVSLTRELTTREYFIDRASRMYSVVLPSMGFTLIASLGCYLLDRSWFISDWSPFFTHPVARLVLNLTFLSQAWGHNTIPFIDLPFWSLGYECVYYAFYGFLFFLRGWKRILLCGGLATVIGPQVLFLFPVWWLGCWLYDFYMRYRRSWVSAATLLATLAWLVVGGTLCLMGHRAILQAPMTAFRVLVSLPNPLVMIDIKEMRATMFAVGTGMLSFVALAPLLFVMDFFYILPSNLWRRWARWIANGTFSIYLMHYPFLVLLTSIGMLRQGHYLSNALIVIAMCLILIAVAVPMDRLKVAMRRWLRSLPYGAWNERPRDMIR